MKLWQALAAAIPACSLLLLGLVPRAGANRQVALFRRVTLALAGLALGWAAASALLLALHGPCDLAFLQFSSPLPICLGVYVDSLTVVMLVLISFIGLIIVRYSNRYLEGEATQGEFLRGMAFTLGAVQLLVISCNLVMFTFAWMLTSYGLHQLLTHYPERSWAVWAARKKFLISRLGDVLLLTALGLTFWNFGTTEYSALFSAAQALHAGTSPMSATVSVIGVLFVLGAMTKSAQFPFHSWLPDTMETPTPVSALMHAGIINAGGFLVIRLSPLVSLSHLALNFLALVGAFTALFGGVVLLTQTSVKRSLAYSTIAQMGFMMLQCGLGAFSAALLHIVAHSAYKAHAFLTCGSVLETAARQQATFPAPRSLLGRLAALPFALVAACGLCRATFWLLGLPADKPGLAVLGLVLTLALTQLIWNGWNAGTWRLAARSMGAAALVSLGYSVAYVATDGVLNGSASRHPISPSPLDATVLALAAAGFLGIFVLQNLRVELSRHRWMQALYVHAMHGFYVDIPVRRLTGRFWSQVDPVP